MKTSAVILKSKQRFVEIDAIKIFAAASIVWLHTVVSPNIAYTAVLGRFSVPFFVATTVFIIFTKVLKGSNISFYEYGKSRFKRIYIPFLTWSAVYLLIRYLNCYFTKLCSKIDLNISVLYTGTTHHLWFLPFILLVSLSSFVLSKLVLKYPKVKTLFAFLAFCAGLGISLSPHPDLVDQLGYTASLSYQAIPALFWGISLAVINNLYGEGKRYRPFLPVLSVLLLILILICLLMNQRNLLLENLGGALLLIFAITSNVGNSSFMLKSATFGQISYGIYLIHILFVEGFQDVAKLFEITEGVFLDISVFALSLFISTQTILAIRKTNFRKWFGT